MGLEYVTVQDRMLEEWGPMHACLDWKNDPKLSTWWCDQEWIFDQGILERGADPDFLRKTMPRRRKEVMANRHWMLLKRDFCLETKNHAMALPSESWGVVGLGIREGHEYRQPFLWPLVVIRVNLAKRWTQYCGWASREWLNSQSYVLDNFRPYKIINVYQDALRTGGVPEIEGERLAPMKTPRQSETKQTGLF